jgi:hypothetical protein
MKTLRAFLVEAVDELDEADLGFMSARAEAVEAFVRATRDWLAQPEILVLLSSGMAESGTVGGAALALRREAVK